MTTRRSSDIKLPGRGPVARAVIASAQQHLQTKVTQLGDWRKARITADEFQKTVASQEKLRQYDPVHALYIYGQNQLSVFIEQLTELPALAKLAQAYAEAEDVYMPSGPPMSPLTHSYFSCWGFFDSCTKGAKKETLATVAIDTSKYLGADPGLIDLFEIMQASRMGIYKHDRTADRYVYLRELITDKEVKAICPSGYLGRPGEIWYARVMPPPFKVSEFDYSVVFTTPYVLGKSLSTVEFNPAVENDWRDYFDRNLIKSGLKDKERAYEQLMKYGPSLNYWNEYVFFAYVNYRHDMVLLAGVPDIPASLPHSEEGQARLEKQ